MTRRVTDTEGARWPTTGTRCSRCHMPTDAVLAGEAHPGCGGPVVNRASIERTVAAVAELLGATEIEQPAEVWRVSAQPVKRPRLLSPERQEKRDVADDH